MTYKTPNELLDYLIWLHQRELLDKLGIDLTEEAGTVLYALPSWVMYAILAAALLLLTLVTS